MMRHIHLKTLSYLLLVQGVLHWKMIWYSWKRDNNSKDPHQVTCRSHPWIRLKAHPRAQLVQSQFITLIMKQTPLFVHSERTKETKTKLVQFQFIMFVMKKSVKVPFRKKLAQKFHRSNPIVQLRSDLSNRQIHNGFNKKNLYQSKKNTQVKVPKFHLSNSLANSNCSNFGTGKSHCNLSTEMFAK